MKNKILILLAIAAFALVSCGDDDKNNGGNNNGNNIITPEPHGAPYDHLGIGEPKGADCGDDCAYKNYNTSTGENAFPKPIYRVGANADGYGDAEIQAATNKIISAYSNNTNGVIKMDIKDVDHFKAILTQPAQIVSGNGAYSLDSGTLKMSVNGSADIADFLKDKAIHDHLGIDEAKCTASAGCELQDYNNYVPRLLTPGDPEDGQFVLNKPIYRYGKEANYTSEELALNADRIIDGFRQRRANYGSEYYDEIMTAINTLCVVKPAAVPVTGGTYVWISDRKLFGVNGVSVNVIGFRLGQIRSGEIVPVGIADGTLVQLQSVSNIRLADSKKKSEQFAVVAARRKWVSGAETV